MTTPTETALAAARAVVKASSGTRLPMDTGRDTPAEELWGALLNLRAALAALDAGEGEKYPGLTETHAAAWQEGYDAGIEAAARYMMDHLPASVPNWKASNLFDGIRALSPAPSAAPMSGPKCANPYCAIEGDHPATSAAPKEEP